MIIVRLATRNDIPKIVDLHVRSWHENYTKSLSAEFLNSNEVERNRNETWNTRFNGLNNKQYVIVAEEDNLFAGFTCMYLDKHEKLGALIDNLHVESAYRCKGVATHLINHAAKWCNEQNPHTSIYLELYAENERAKKFYHGLKGKLTTQEPFSVRAVDGGQTLAFHVTWENPSSLVKITEEKINFLKSSY